MRYIGREEAEALFRGAVQRAAEKYAEEAVCEAQNMRKADRRSVRRFRKRFRAYKSGGIQTKPHRSGFFAEKRNRAVSAACAAAICLAGLFAVIGLWDGAENTAQTPAVIKDQLFQKIFIYENGQYHYFDENRGASLTADSLQSGKRSMKLSAGGIVGIEDPNIMSLAYQCENGWLSFGDSNEESSRKLEIPYYEGYCEDLRWSAWKDDSLADSDSKSAESSGAEAEVFTITAKMKDGSFRRIRVLLSQEGDSLRAEIKEISECS